MEVVEVIFYYISYYNTWEVEELEVVVGLDDDFLYGNQLVLEDLVVVRGCILMVFQVIIHSIILSYLLVMGSEYSRNLVAMDRLRNILEEMDHQHNNCPSI